MGRFTTEPCRDSIQSRMLLVVTDAGWRGRRLKVSVISLSAGTSFAPSGGFMWTTFGGSGSRKLSVKRFGVPVSAVWKFTCAVRRIRSFAKLRTVATFGLPGIVIR